MKRLYRVALLALVATGIVFVSPGRTQERSRGATRNKPAATAAIDPFIGPEYIPIEAQPTVPEESVVAFYTYNPPPDDIPVAAYFDPPSGEWDLVGETPEQVVVGSDGYIYEAAPALNNTKKWVRGERLYVQLNKLQGPAGAIIQGRFGKPGEKYSKPFRIGVRKR